jgi:chromatin remodeling complex protein RSC6
MSYPIRISTELSNFLKLESDIVLTRIQLNKLLWNYIKINNLQSNQNPKRIVPNIDLMLLFGLSPGETLNLFTFLNHITLHIRR